MTFENFEYSKRQIGLYLENAKKDLARALKYDDTDLSFRLGYDALIKLAITVCALEGLRIKSRIGHHIELLEKAAAILKNPKIREIGDMMRRKRNRDLYGGGIFVSAKEAEEARDFLVKTFDLADDFLNKKIGKMKLF